MLLFDVDTSYIHINYSVVMVSYTNLEISIHSGKELLHSISQLYIDVKFHKTLGYSGFKFLNILPEHY